MNKRILVISTFFEKKYQYQEVQIADTLHRMGFDTTVITSNRSPFGKKKRVENTEKPYKIIRLKKLIRITNTLCPVGNFKEMLKGINPDIVFLIHPGHGIPYFMMKYLPVQSKVISIFGDLWDNFSLGLQNRIVKKLIKNRWYRKVFNKSDFIVANTNETFDIFKSYKFYKNNIENKLLRSSLGYDSNLFFFNSALRNKYRVKYNISSENLVLITITRIVSYKPILEWIKPIMKAMKENKNLIYTIAGFSDSDYSSMVKDNILSSYVADQFILIDLVESLEMNALFNYADFGVWFGATISIQQSMGTGLPTIIPKNRTLDHLVTKDKNGMFFTSETDLCNKLVNLKKIENRKQIYKYNQKFSYQTIIKKMLLKLNDI